MPAVQANSAGRTPLSNSSKPADSATHFSGHCFRIIPASGSFMRTSPGAGSGICGCTISKSHPGLETWAALHRRYSDFRSSHNASSEFSVVAACTIGRWSARRTRRLSAPLAQRFECPEATQYVRQRRPPAPPVSTARRTKDDKNNYLGPV
jgi:hypothetical protein